MRCRELGADIAIDYHDDVPAAPLLVNLGQQANFVPEGGQSLVTAQQEAITKLAQQIVGQMELAW